MPLLIAALLGLTAALIVAFPLLGLTRGQTEASAPGALGEVADRERQARQALREVELDYTLGQSGRRRLRRAAKPLRAARASGPAYSLPA